MRRGGLSVLKFYVRNLSNLRRSERSSGSTLSKVQGPTGDHELTSSEKVSAGKRADWRVWKAGGNVRFIDERGREAISLRVSASFVLGRAREGLEKSPQSEADRVVE